ncbi:MAG: tryptophan synthase subunit alpha, partial [Bacteroidota bacterium]
MIQSEQQVEQSSSKISNRITRLFEQEKGDLLSIFFTAGHPNLEDTLPMIQHLEANGVDMIEVGIPFSDPIADGQ